VALGLAAYVVPVDEQVHFLVVRDGDVVAQHAGRFLPRSRLEVDGVAGDESAWLRSRAGLPDVPPTPVARPAADPIVLLLTIDCMRYDLVGGSPRIELPHLASLREDGVLFERAQAPGSSTAYVLSSIFSGRYYSQLEWSQTGGGGIFPSTDRTPRFPELLARGDVWTVQAGSFDWLDNTRGVARGFDVFDYAELPGPRWKTAEALTDALVARLGEIGDRPAFLYAHFNDPHLPYDRGGTRGTPFERYARELQLVDRELGRILRAIDRQGLRSRTIVMVTADHGEAFGEHGRTAHAGSLYQELTHVPLVIRGPRIEPRSITEPVSLIDLGPTILDVFGLPTPARFMGESFYPALLGRPFTPTRPLVAQAGHLRSLITRERLKVVRDVRRGTVEAYDLDSDPRELRNLIGSDRTDVAEALSVLDAFFQVHQFRRPGYVDPFR
jgi:arylsulfatase A-like enzyme